MYNGLSSIGEKAFYGCTNMRQITVPGSVESIGANAFGNCSSSLTVIVEEGSPAEEYCIRNNIAYIAR